jgi:hypothetical protein
MSRNFHREKQIKNSKPGHLRNNRKMLFEKDFLSSADPSISGECGIKVLSTEQVLGVQGTSSRPLRKILWRLISERCRGLWM